MISKEEALKQYKDILEKLNIPEDEELGGLIYLDLNKDDIKEIISHSAFSDTDISHNYAPVTQMFINFINDNPQFIAEGYLVNPNRDDYRFEIVGVKAKANRENKEALYDFINSLPDGLAQPDEYGDYEGYVRAWWD